MSFAPILDPSAYTSETEPQRQRALAAAAALQRLARDDQVLLSAVHLVTDPPASTTGKEPPAAVEDVRQQLTRLQGGEAELAKSGLPPDELLVQLMRQLRQVKAFCEVDGGKIDDYIKPVGRLIRSGRVELFAG